MPPNEAKDPEFLSIRRVGMGGLVTKSDPQDIADIESPDLRNIFFEGGFPSNRFGTTLQLAEPVGETGVPTQLLKGMASDGTQYLIALYGTNFYLYDSVNVQWILLNNGLTPTLTQVPYGYASWPNGKQDDRLYFGNGTDDTIRWNMALGYLKNAAAAADGTITLKDSSRFPSSGNILVMGSSGVFALAYTANNTATGVLTITGTVGQVVNSGAAVTTPLIDASGVKKGKVFAKFQGRLIIANYKGAETTVNGSKQGDPETWTPGSNIGDPFTWSSTTGEGGVTDIEPFGLLLIIHQINMVQQLSIELNSSLNAQQIIVTPLTSGDNMGSISKALTIMINNALYYPTETAGVFQLVPAASGSLIAMTSVTMIGQNIYPTLTDPSFTFDSGKGEAYHQKLFWLCSNLVTSKTQDKTKLTNNLILIYDLIWNIWTIWDNINAADLKQFNGTLYFLCSDDGGLYYYDTTSFQDQRGGQNIGYTSYLSSKNWDFGKSANPKQTRFALVQGYISQNTVLNITAIFNNGALANRSFKLAGTDKIVNQVPVYGIGRASIGQNPLGGFQQGTIGQFRVYLDLGYFLGGYTVQLKMQTQNIGDNFIITGLSFNPEEVMQVPSELVISPS